MRDQELKNLVDEFLYLVEVGSGSQVADESELARLSPLKRLIEPEEVARIVVLLSGSAAAGINGQAWNIDGGGVMS